MSCDINELLNAGRCFQCLSEQSQLAVIAQLLCDISESGGGGGGSDAASPFNVTDVANPELPYEFTATRRTRIEVNYQIRTGDDDTELRAERPIVGQITIGKMFGFSGVPLQQIWTNTLNLGPGETLRLTKAINATGDVDILHILIYEE